MRSLFLIVVALAACDLRPAPKKSPPVATTPTDVPPPPEPTGSAAAPTPTPTPTPTPPAPVDAAVAPPPVDAFETTAVCNDVGVKVAASIIDMAQDPAQKATLTQERDRIVRRVAEACTRDNWPAPARDCFIKAKTNEEMTACGRNLVAAPPGEN